MFKGWSLRKQRERVLWPVYFDSSKTRREGRRISKALGTPKPSLKELVESAKRLGWEPEIEVEAAHPAIPWRRTGRISVQADGTKAQNLTRLANELKSLRRETKL
jgi:signal recognition particle subunit SRP19